MNTRATSPGGSWGTLWKTLILTIALLVNVSLGFRLFWGQQSVATYTKLKEQREVMQAALDQQDSVNAGLSREIRLLQTDTRYVEKMIRQRLNYVKSNEVLYLFDGGQDSSATGAAGHERKN